MNGGAKRGRGTAIVRCSNILAAQPHKLVCNYSFRAAYRAMPKIGFPTLGVPNAGKTWWLAMTYYQLNLGGHVPKEVHFRRIDSEATRELDRLVKRILFERIDTKATQAEKIPHPVVFDFRDRDWLGRSDALLSIFDFSGEVTKDHTLDDHRRQRALKAEGYFFFLDPTKDQGDQVSAMSDLCEHARLVHEVGGDEESQRPVPLPVALCMSKVDVLASPAFKGLLPDFRKELAAIDNEHRKKAGGCATLRLLRARAELMWRVQRLLFPDWDLEKTLRERFGPRYCFFPVASQGLDGKSDADLSQRTFSPYGIFEPLLWLLHMNGYPILRR